MDFRWGGGYDVGCINLEVALFNKKTPDSLDNFGAQPEVLLLGR